ncbi:NlpC/P60 family [Rubrobacter radiotolerans]|uniref:NlpC/P60 family n=1 Tax=Rubrobacter radiotolerans TaxID=42256 RepID=A0A023X630_RUBRA|nr:NlpC/P60 family protein [Rubrobacter radiotolerans]AHY47455.1 NlpC/P60 family [Rubrobacter radiotolerans]MDX5894858.1 NlpC/P60 family protein [Rubrobacter radiotolerans]SMC06936.1 Cell wall-associated hydrolase, NlpC family [Rubrobacter radiotolerans DSM 5868]
MKRLARLGLAGTFAAFAALAVVMFTGSGAQAADPYSQVVDNSTQGRFTASGWKLSSYSTARYGPDYRYIEPNTVQKPAVYKMNVPRTGQYTVLVRFPSNAGYNAKTRYVVLTESGAQRKIVNQQKNGGKWVKLGVYRLTAGDKPVVRVAPASGAAGYIIADAVRIVEGDFTPNTGTSTGGTGSAGGTTSGGTTTALSGADVIREAKTWLGVPYSYGGTTRSGVDCSGLTQAVYRNLGIAIPRTAADQYNSGPGQQVSTSDRQRGYLIFGNAGGQGIQHVGILVGNGNMIHAPVPGTVVREEAVGSWYNVLGVKKILPA